MCELNRDILYSIFEILKDDKKNFPSCLLVNKTWCEMSVPILWRDHWKYLNMKRKASLLNVIISHLSDETKNNLIKNQKIFINSFNTNNINSYQKPLLFNYINFCKHLNLNIIMNMISIIETSKKSILQNPYEKKMSKNHPKIV